MVAIVNVVRADRLARDLEDEQRFHLEARADDLMAAGLPPDAARTEAARRFGHQLQLREASRDARLLPWLESLVRDLRLGVRLLRQDAMVSTAAVLSLGLAIGACTAAFALIDALMLRELPVREPDRLVYFKVDGRTDLRFAALVSYPFFDRFRQARIPDIEVFAMSHQSLRQALLPDGAASRRRSARSSSRATPSTRSASRPLWAASSARPTTSRPGRTRSPSSATPSGRGASAPIRARRAAGSRSNRSPIRSSACPRPATPAISPAC